MVSNNTFLLYSEDPYLPSPPTTGVYGSFSKFSLFDNKYLTVYGLDIGNLYQYESEITNYVNGNFTIGFWMKTSSALGFVRHFITKNKTAKTAPILAKSNKAIVSNEEIIDDATFIIREEAYSETKNRIAVLLSSDGTSVANTAYSESYLPGLHHYLISYDESNSRIRIDVDGYFGDWQSAPSSLYSSAVTFKLNCVNPNYLLHQATRTQTLLRDLYLKNSVSEDDSEAVRNYKYGVGFVTYDTLVDLEFGNFSFSFSQPNTIAVNDIISNGSNVYLGLSNGELLKGEQKYWDNNITFNSEQKNQSLDISNNCTFSYGEDGILIKGGFVKI